MRYPYTADPGKNSPVLQVALLSIHGDAIDALARTQDGLVGAMVEVIRDYLHPRMMFNSRVEQLQQEFDLLNETYRMHWRRGNDMFRIKPSREEHLAIAEGLSERVELLQGTLSRSRALEPLLGSLKTARAADPVETGEDLASLFTEDDERNVLTLLFRYLESVPDLHLVIEPARIHG